MNTGSPRCPGRFVWVCGICRYRSNRRCCNCLVVHFRNGELAGENAPGPVVFGPTGWPSADPLCPYAVPARTAAIATASNVFIVFILSSNFVELKGSNIQPQARPDVAEFGLAFAIVWALFRQTSI